MARALMSDEEWALLAPHLAPISSRSGRPPRSHRQTLDAIFWIAHRRAPWRDLPETLGNWNRVYRQFRRWSKAGLWARLSAALGDIPRQGSREQWVYSLPMTLPLPNGTGDLRALVSAVGSLAFNPGVSMTLSTKTESA